MYLHWKQITLENPTDIQISALYAEGFVFTRIAPYTLDQTRSVRIDLTNFSLSSENKRILKKNDALSLEVHTIPYNEYNWQIGKLGKDFYEQKFGPKIFSANKIKELLTNKTYHFNTLLVYRHKTQGVIGYCIAYENTDMLHYSYPFYTLDTENKNLGMGMMLLAITYAQKKEKKYIYLGSAQRNSDSYKLQFKGLEWFDGKKWQSDINDLKLILKETPYEND